MKLFGNSSRGGARGRYATGKQAERRSAPVQPDVQRPESDEDEIPLLRDYANREAAQHGPETEKDDNPLLQQYLKRPPLAQNRHRKGKQVAKLAVVVAAVAYWLRFRRQKHAYPTCLTISPV